MRIVIGIHPPHSEGETPAFCNGIFPKEVRTHREQVVTTTTTITSSIFVIIMIRKLGPRLILNHSLRKNIYCTIFNLNQA